jgi:4-methyl-5(b-hydroxyethyl)-thiazole monophosphate biosynthesis
MNYVFLATGFEDLEAITIYDVLHRAGLPVEYVSITDEYQVVGAHGTVVVAHRLFSEIDSQNVQSLLLPGGMPGATHLLAHKGLTDLLIEKSKTSVLLGALCASPMILGRLGLLKGKKATVYPGFEEALEGAILCNDSSTVEDGTIITGKGPGVAIDFALHIVTYLKDASSAQRIAESMLFV